MTLTEPQFGDFLEQIEKGKAPLEGEIRRSQPPAPKRKASTELLRSDGKQTKTEQNAANTSRPIAPARGLGNGSKITVESTAVKSVSKVGRASPAIQNNPVPYTAPVINRPPPKVGSHAWIMERAKANQQTLAHGGKIQHKTMERGVAAASSKNGRSAGGASWSSRGPGAAGARDAKNGSVRPGEKDAKNGSLRPGEKEDINGAGKGKPKDANGRKAGRVVEPPVKRVKKSATATTGYTGTARPKTALVKPSPRVGNSTPAAAPRREPPPASRPPKNKGPRIEKRYHYADDDEEEEEDDDGFITDASSDMEAAAFEVDEEEEAALRQARLEDAEEERRLRREAEEKRRRKALAGRS